MINDGFKTRLKIAKKNAKTKYSSPKKSEPKSGIGLAFKMSTELVSAVLVGTIIGFILDSWFDTKPWFIITFFFIGVIAGMLNVIRVAKSMQSK